MRVQTVIMLIVPFAAALSVSPARAERAAGPCREDIQKLCPDAKPGGGAFRNCLTQHAAELSPECTEHLKQMKAKVEEWRQACQNDVQQLCAGVDAGRGNILRCLRQHREQLSQTCQDQLAKGHRRHRHHAQAAQPTNQPGGQ